jgi:tetratricopeptide (TPR) repeat protein
MCGKSAHEGSFRRLTAGWPILFCAAVLAFMPMNVQAFQVSSGHLGSTDETRIIRDAWGAFNVKNFLIAKQHAEKVRDASGATGEDARRLIKLVDDIMSNNKKRENAIIAIARGNSAQACALLTQIKAAIDANKELASYYSDLSGLKQKAGGCAPQEPQIDPLLADYDKAQRLMEKKRFQEAIGILNRIRSTNARYRDIEQLIAETNQEINNDKKKSQDDRFEELTKSAGQLLDEGDFRKARHKLNLALAMRPGDPSAKSIQQRIETGVGNEMNELSKGLVAFYDGRYAEAQKGLDEILRGKHSPSIMALTHFYAGAALSSEFLLAGGKDKSKKDAALKAFQQTLVADPGYAPRWDAVSPKIKQIYSEAVENHLKTK